MLFFIYAQDIHEVSRSEQRATQSTVHTLNPCEIHMRCIKIYVHKFPSSHPHVSAAAAIKHVKMRLASKIRLTRTFCTCFYVTVIAVSPAAGSTTHCHCPVVLWCEHSRTIGAFLMRRSMVFNVGSISTSNSGYGLMWKRPITFQPLASRRGNFR